MDKYDELENLQQLKNNGTITDVEYEIEKSKILNKIEKNNNSDDGDTASLVLGLISFFLGGFILGIIGWIVSIKTKKRLAKDNKTSNKVIIGLILSILATLKGIVLIILIIASFYVMKANSTIDNIKTNEYLSAEEVLAHNSRYEAYTDKDLTYENVKALITLVKLRNAEDYTNKTYLMYNGAGCGTNSDLDKLVTKLSSYKTYTAKALYYYDNGYIKTIEIKEK
ncbi:MAG: hypothetical protein J6M60_06995 [Clostridia bacterium]|nr:hypothetical protein [Clostridia bacterium]